MSTVTSNETTGEIAINASGNGSPLWIQYIELNQLKSAVSRAILATDRESYRFALGCVQLSFRGGYLNVVGSDGRRLHRTRIETSGEVLPAKLIYKGYPHNSQEWLIPASEWKAIKWGKRPPKLVAIEWHDSKIVIRAGDKRIELKSTTGRFPQWTDILPDSPQGQADIVSTCETWKDVYSRSKIASTGIAISLERGNKDRVKGYGKIIANDFRPIKEQKFFVGMVSNENVLRRAYNPDLITPFLNSLSDKENVAVIYAEDKIFLLARDGMVAMVAMGLSE